MCNVYFDVKAEDPQIMLLISAYVTRSVMALWLEFSAVTGCDVNKTIARELVVIVNIYRHYFCYINCDISY